MSELKKVSQLGSDNPNWKGGSSSFKRNMYGLSTYWDYKKAALKRDNYNCTKCGTNNTHGNRLELHHIKPFSELYAEFLNTYNQFSPIEDWDILIRLAITHKPFWELDNATILCSRCHRLTDSYPTQLVRRHLT